jgi:hypothetical protein
MQFESKYNIGDIVIVDTDNHKLLLTFIDGIIAIRDGIFYRGTFPNKKGGNTIYMYNTKDEEYHFQNGASAIYTIKRKIGEMTIEEMENIGSME